MFYLGDKMPDISMCRNENCLRKEKCYRYMAKPEEFQWYSDFATDDGKDCDYYWAYIDPKIIGINNNGSPES